jgi:hypothetical protein
VRQDGDFVMENVSLFLEQDDGWCDVGLLSRLA